MTTDCLHCPLRRLAAFDSMSAREVEFMRSFKSSEVTVPAGATVLSEGSDSPHLFTVLDGYGTRSISLPDGRRQVINFVMKGDLLGLQAEMLGEMTHSVEAATRMVLCVFSRGRVWEVFNLMPSRAYAMTWLAAREESLLDERLVSVGRMSGEERVAHGLAVLYLRGQALELVREGRMPLPFRQRDFADALGLSLVHTNKILRLFRERGICTWRDGVLAMEGLDALMAETWVDERIRGPRPLI